jgi:hypothetical protein
MAVLLVATFPILLLINSPAAVLGLTVGIWLLYRDHREESLARPGPWTRPLPQARPKAPRRRPRPRQRIAA